MKKEQIINVNSYLNSLKMEVSSELGVNTNPNNTNKNKTNKTNKQQKKS